jgi:hypothetical protein
MPHLICRFCNKEFNLKLPYYCHLHIHINVSTINEFTKDELDTINKYYNNRKQVHRKSHYKHVINPKHECLLCDYKSKQTAAYEKHLISSHTKEELLTNNDEQYIDTLINKYKNVSTHQLPIPQLPIHQLPANIHLLPFLIPLSLINDN